MEANPKPNRTTISLRLDVDHLRRLKRLAAEANLRGESGRPMTYQDLIRDAVASYCNNHTTGAIEQ